MGRRKKKRPAIHRDKYGEFRWETYFIRGKQRRQKVRLRDGEEFGELDYIKANGDDIWLLQEGYHEILHEREMERQKFKDESESEINTDERTNPKGDARPF